MSNFAFEVWRDTSCNLSSYSCRTHIFRQERNSGVWRRRVDRRWNSVKDQKRVIAMLFHYALQERSHEGGTTQDADFPKLRRRCSVCHISASMIASMSASMSASMIGARSRSREKEWRRSKEFSGESARSSLPDVDFHDDPIASEGHHVPTGASINKKNRRACNSQTLCVISTQSSDGDVFLTVQNTFYAEHVMHAGTTTWTKLLTCDDCSGMTFSALHSVCLRRHSKWPFLSRPVPVEPAIFVPVPPSRPPFHDSSRDVSRICVACLMQCSESKKKDDAADPDRSNDRHRITRGFRADGISSSPHGDYDRCSGPETHSVTRLEEKGKTLRLTKKKCTTEVIGSSICVLNG